MLGPMFIPFDIFQLLSSLEVARHIYLRKSIYGISLDFALYSWVWAGTHALANSLYTFLPTIHSQYAARYPLFPGIPYAMSLTCLSLLQFCVCTVIARKCFYGLKTQEKLSVVCKTVLGCSFSVFMWFFWLYCHGRATINALDLADCLHNIGSIAMASRLIPQASLNWFLDTFVLSRTFLLLQLFSVASGSFALLSAYLGGTKWYELPISLPSQAVLATTWCALAVLVVQRKIYGSNIIFPLNR